MKLFEIQHTVTQSSIHSVNIKNVKDSENVNHLGSGQDAIVFQSKRPSAQGTVTKWIYNSLADFNNEPSLQYILFGNQSNNPLVPRVYSIKQIDKQASHDFVVEMEKLYPLKNLDVNDPMMVEAVLLSIFEPIGKHVDATFRNDIDFASMVSKIMSKIGNDTTFIGCTRTLNSNAKAVKQHLLHAINNSDAYNDIHEDNIMLRYTSTGTQLVITDPLYTSDSKAR